MFFNQSCNKKQSKENKKDVLVNETTYHINKSKSKWISVGYSIERKYEPVIKLGGIKNNQCVVFNENQFTSFLNNQGIMMSFIYSTTSGWQPMKVDGYEIHFVFIGDSRIIKIVQDDNNEIFLAGDSINEIVNLSDLIKYRYDIIKCQDFSNYYNILISSASSKNGDIIKNIYDVIVSLRNVNSVNACCVMELLTIYPKIVIEDVESLTCNIFVKNIDEK